MVFTDWQTFWKETELELQTKIDNRTRQLVEIQNKVEMIEKKMLSGLDDNKLESQVNEWKKLREKEIELSEEIIKLKRSILKAAVENLTCF